jgi:hypothetical protein
MHAARWLLGLSASFAAVAAVASGCGGNTSGAAPIEDSGPDVTMEAAPMEAAVEAAVEAAPEAAPVVDAACVPDANINNLPIPDASFGDAGATAASCISCFRTSCPTLITMCNEECVCVAAFEEVASCLGMGGALETCGAPLLNVPGVSLSDLICAAGCAVPSVCGYSLPSGGGDSGTSGDSATTGDAPAE